jgi:esterase/lipase superfamily enzyme
MSTVPTTRCRAQAAQAAQLRHFTGRRIVVLAFVWPSAGSLLRYFTDVGNAKASVKPFARLVEMLAEHTDASAIDVLAYSAGAQVVSPALALLGTSPRPGEKRQQLRERLRLKNIYFAAADIDTRQFINELGMYVDIVKGVSKRGEPQRFRRCEWRPSCTAPRVSVDSTRPSSIPKQSGFLLEGLAQPRVST